MQDNNWGLKVRTILEAKEEARRFIKAADAALKMMKQYRIEEHWTGRSKETATLRRASMDLTRKLADMRAGR